MAGVELKPIRLRKSLYLLVPMEVAKIIGVNEKTKFMLTLRSSEETVLVYNKVEAAPQQVL